MFSGDSQAVSSTQKSRIIKILMKLEPRLNIIREPILSLIFFVCSNSFCSSLVLSTQSTYEARKTFSDPIISKVQLMLERLRKFGIEMIVVNRNLNASSEN